ncbi:MAG: hypothetical protein K2Q11_11680 [Burkholderiaceae bacterium]|nr:hypothetical protein [Burkholderiaceae bacterium]
MNSTSPPPTTSAMQQRTAWLLFAPPALLAGLRWLLDWHAGRGPQTPLLALSPFSGAQTLPEMLWQMAWPLLLLLAVGGVAMVAYRRCGARPVQRALAVGWVLLCMAACAALLLRHLNVQQVQPLPPVQAQVLGSRVQAPSTRSAGGTQLVLRLDGQEALQQVLIDDPEAAQWQPGQRLTLQWVQGRYRGLFVTGWQPLPHPAAVSVHPTPPAGALLR